jgi:hypothetical protein
LEGRHSAITYFHLLDCRPHACDNTAELVAKDITFLEIWDGLYKLVTDTASAGRHNTSLTVKKSRHTVEQVQITPANGAARHFKYDIAFIDDLRASRLHYKKPNKQETRILCR